MESIFSEISDDDLLYDRFEIICTESGFMPYDHDCDEFLYDENGNNCFDSYWTAAALVDDAIIAIKNDY